MKERIDWIDILKGIGICSVIVGHLCALNAVRVIIYMFHMPLFFIVNGFFLNTERDNVDIIVKRAAKRYLCPYFIISLVVLAVDFLTQEYSFSNWKEILFRWFGVTMLGSPNNSIPGNVWNIPRVGPIWFLEALFWSETLVALLKKIKSFVTQCIIVIVVAYAAAFFSRIIWIPANFLNGLATGVFVMIGIIVKKHVNFEKLFKPRIVLLSIGSSLILFLMYIKTHQRPSVSTICYPFWGIDLIGILSTVLIISFISKWIFVHTYLFKEILKMEGQSSLCILAVHTIDMVCLKYPPQSNGGGRFGYDFAFSYHVIYRNSNQLVS